MSVRIIKKGLLDTIQDKGRYEHQHLGINPGGVMDNFAASIANILTGNEVNEAVIEMHFPAAGFLFEEDALIALSGADFDARINKQPIPINTGISVSKNSVLEFASNKKGARCYLAVHGGWQAKQWLNSCSTNLKVNAGGFEGRALKKDDVLAFKQQQNNLQANFQNGFAVTSNTVDVSAFCDANAIRCVRGSAYQHLNDESKYFFSSSSFIITPQSDRMGYRLQGEALTPNTNKELLSSAVTRGTIQLLPSGQMIVLMADHQTIGGYPIIAHVISADLPALAQKNPNEPLHFELVEHADAEKLFIEQQQKLILLKQEIAGVQLK